MADKSDTEAPDDTEFKQLPNNRCIFNLVAHFSLDFSGKVR